MSGILCPCGAILRDDYDVEYYFIPDSTLKENEDTRAFFDIWSCDTSTEIWRCIYCDRLIVFNDDLSVSRHMKRINTELLKGINWRKNSVEGICCSIDLIDEVELYLSQERSNSTRKQYAFYGDEKDNNKILLTPAILLDEIITQNKRRFQNWWKAFLSNEFFIFLSPRKEEVGVPVKAWQRCEHIWDDNPE